MHLIYFTPEITEFLKRKDFSLEKQYLILFNLKTIMEKYSKLLSDNIEEIPEKERYIDVKELRKSIELLYKGENLFKMGQNGDPADLLFLFLNSIHSYYMKAHSLKYSIEKECNPLCPSHEFFWLNLVQQYECQSCKGTSDILKFDYNFFIYEIFMKKIIFKVQKLKNFDQFHNKFFLFSKEINSKTRIDCPSKCKNQSCRPYYAYLSDMDSDCYLNTSTVKGYAIEPTDKKVFNKCYQTCDTCKGDQVGDETKHNCLTCKSGYVGSPDGSSDNGKFCIICLESYSNDKKWIYDREQNDTHCIDKKQVIVLQQRNIIYQMINIVQIIVLLHFY